MKKNILKKTAGLFAIVAAITLTDLGYAGAAPGLNVANASETTPTGTPNYDSGSTMTIASAEQMLDNYCGNLKQIYIFTVENSNKLSIICNNAKGYLQSHTNMNASEISAYVSQIESQMNEFATKNGVEDTPLASTSEFIGLYDNFEVPTATYGKTCQIVLPVINYCEEYLSNVKVTPQLSTDSKEWPFEIESTGYAQIIASLPGNKTADTLYDHRQEISWMFTTREDVVSGYYELKFDVSYERNGAVEKAVLSTYVKVKGSPDSDSKNEEENGKVSTPRIVVNGFETNPAQIFAGDTFTLTLHIQNTSDKTTVSNILFDLEAASTTDASGNAVAGVAAFLPTSGSSTIFQDQIAPNGVIDISIEMTARADLSQKPYVLAVSMAYEDEKSNPYTQSANVSIPIYQESKFELSSIDIEPNSIAVGDETNIMFSIYNTGKTTLYNVQVKFDETYVTGGDVFIGKLDSGATGSVDTMLTAMAPNEGTITAHISYEDESGNVTTMDKDLELYTYEMVYDDTGMGDMPFEDPMLTDTSAKKTPLWIYIAAGVAAAAVIIAVIVLIVVKKNKKKKKMLQELDDTDDEIL